MIDVYKVNEVYVRIVCDRGQALELKDYFSCFAPNYRFNPKFKRKLWNGKISFFELSSHLLPMGLLPFFDKFCNKPRWILQVGGDENGSLSR